jgi:hypothetical protein
MYLQQDLAGEHRVDAAGALLDLDAILDRRQGRVQPARTCMTQ